MKKFILIVLVITMTVLCASMLVACKDIAPALFSEENLAASAKINRTEINGIKNGRTEINFGETKTFNTLVLKEKNDNVTKFQLFYKRGEEFVMFYEQDRIDQYRVCAFEEINTDILRIDIISTKGKTKVNSVEVYNVQKKEKDIIVSEYMTTEKQVVQRLKDDEGFRGYFNIMTDLIIIGEIGLDSNANIDYREEEQDFIDDLEALRYAMGDNKVRIRPTIHFDMGSYDETRDFINTHKEKIGLTLRDFCVKHDLAGVDFDWEYPQTSSQWKAYDTIINVTAQALNTLGKNVSVALPHWGVRLKKSTIENIAFVNLMSYDIFDSRGDHASIYTAGAEAVAKLNRAGVPLNKICLGLSFYGRTTNRSGSAWPDYNYDYNNGATLGKWGNYLESFEYIEDGETKTCDAYLNGYAINRDKTAYAIAAELGGIMIFRAKCDTPYTYEYSLHKAVEEAINQRIV